MFKATVSKYSGDRIVLYPPKEYQDQEAPWEES